MKLINCVLKNVGWGTEKLDLFPQNLLVGKSKREAFSIAQNTVRNNQNFTNPHYCAGFIMLD